MRFYYDTFGTLVRPRILSYGMVYPLHSPASSSWTPSKKANRPHLFFPLFNKTIPDLFSELKLGNTTKDLSSCYVAVVTHYLVKVGSQTALVDKSNIQETLKKVRKLLGQRTNLRILCVGVQFFKGVEKDQETGELKPVNSWNPKLSTGESVLWFFYPWELISFKDIMKFESVENGDAILFQKSSCLISRKKLLNKPSFFSTSSWSCYSITMLNSKGDGYLRFIPGRKFEIIKGNIDISYRQD